MAKFVLGKTPEQVQAEEAEKQRELEAAIQATEQERLRKIQELHKKQAKYDKNTIERIRKHRFSSN